MVTHFEPATKYQKYQRLLNNLLNIIPHDAALFTRLNKRNFDLLIEIGLEATTTMLTQPNFKISLVNHRLEELLKLIKKATLTEQIVEAYKAKKERLTKVKRLALDKPGQFIITKNQLIEELATKLVNHRNQWLTYRREALDSNIQDNIWPLHIATFFVSVKTPLKTIYGPLLLKETLIEFDGQNPYLVSAGPWKLNEKLIFILNESGFKINENWTFDEALNAHDVEMELIKALPIDPVTSISWQGKFADMVPESIDNEELMVHPGVVLGMFKASGGHLRRTMLEIIENDDLDKILKPITNKRVYQERVEDFILNQSDKLLRIQNSNFSQDKALISALIQDTIIWGPPGTGKSQVIANIIANVLFYDKTAVVMSQKKAALDVLRKRLGNLAPFVLFILNDNQLSKEAFYAPLKHFVSLVEYSQKVPLKRKYKIISPVELQSLEAIQNCKAKATFDSTLDLVKRFGETKSLSDFFALDKNYVFPTLTEPCDFKHYQRLFLNSNQNDKSKMAFGLKKYARDYRLQVQKSYNILGNNPHLELNKLLTLAEAINYDETLALNNSCSIFNRRYSQDLDSDYLVGHLANQILNKIEVWKINNPTKFEAYHRFASAIRAGRRLPYKFINDHAAIIQELFPVIITTPDTAFIHWSKEYYDYVIVDESSQIFAETGLPLLYIGKTKVLAGDTQQMQPSNWFGTRVEEDDFGPDIPENTLSVLTYAFDKGVYQVMLDQNFRSQAAALMSFSSKHFYQSQLEAIDQRKDLVAKGIRQSIVVKNVNGKWSKGINEKEALEVIKLLKQKKNQFDKILVLTFNFAQKQWLEKLIYENHSDLATLIEKEKVILRNIENVQGDEADLVIMSLIYDNQTNLTATYIAKPGGKNALNVAISRAREQIIVLKSLEASKVKASPNSDLLMFKHWLEFLVYKEDQQKVYAQLDTMANTKKPMPEPMASNFKTEIETNLKKELLANKYVTIKPQYAVGSQNIDFGVVDVFNAFKLGIQVDDYHYDDDLYVQHYLTDLSNQEFLQYKGYPIYRIREIDWRLHKDQIIKEVNHLLSQ